MKLKLLLKKPSLILMIAVCLTTAVLLLTYSAYYRVAEQTLARQQEAIVHRSLEYTVQIVNRKLEEITLTAQNIRSDLRYVPMPASREHTVETRLGLLDASESMFKSLSGIADLVETAYFYNAETDYAVLSTHVADVEKIVGDMEKAGFTREEVEGLHKTYSTGQLVVSGNGQCLAYLLSAGVDRATGFPTRQLVILLRREFLQHILTNTRPLNARYTLQNAAGTLLDDVQLGSASESCGLYSYPLSSGYTLNVQIEHDYLDQEVQQVRNFYLLALVIGLLLVAGITIAACRMSAIPINQLIEYIRSHYQGEEPAKGEGLLAIRSAVDDIWVMHQETLQQLEELQASRQWERLTRTLHGETSAIPAWYGERYVLMLFTLPTLEEQQLLKAVRKVAQEGQEYAILNLTEGISLLVEAISDQQAGAFAESLLAVLDEHQAEPARVAMSDCHTALEELPMAYREARMAMDCLVMEMDMPVMSWQKCDLSQRVMMLDGEYLARQQRFDRMILQGNMAEAQECLKTLISDFFLNDPKIANSQIGRMHLEMVRYQMMGSLEQLYRNTAEDIELRRAGIRALLLCRNHAQVLELMTRQLAEAAQPEEIAAEESGGDEMLTQVKMYVRENYADQQLSVASLAEIFDLSPNALSKLFSRKADMGVLQYIHKIRIEKACNLMLNTSLNLTEIAQQVGYTNQLTFTRSFKARYHMTPMQWRKSKEDL